MKLDETIALHRELYRADPASVTRLVVRYPPVTKSREGDPEGEPADGVGMNLSAKMIRYLGHPEGYGEVFPWRSALWSLRGECRRTHRYHRDERWNGSLCEFAIRAVIMARLSVPEAQARLGYPTLTRIVREGLEYMEAHLDARQRAASLDQAEVETHEPPVHRSLPGLHQEECPICRQTSSASAL
jgi:hypothetical protein